MKSQNQDGATVVDVLDPGGSESDRRGQLQEPVLEIDRRAENKSTAVKSGE